MTDSGDLFAGLDSENQDDALEHFLYVWSDLLGDDVLSSLLDHRHTTTVSVATQTCRTEPNHHTDDNAGTSMGTRRDSTGTSVGTRRDNMGTSVGTRRDNTGTSMGTRWNVLINSASGSKSEDSSRVEKENAYLKDKLWELCASQAACPADSDDESGRVSGEAEAAAKQILGELIAKAVFMGKCSDRNIDAFLPNLNFERQRFYMLERIQAAVESSSLNLAPLPHSISKVQVLPPVPCSSKQPPPSVAAQSGPPIKRRGRPRKNPLPEPNQTIVIAPIPGRKKTSPFPIRLQTLGLQAESDAEADDIPQTKYRRRGRRKASEEDTDFIPVYELGHRTNSRVTKEYTTRRMSRKRVKKEKINDDFIEPLSENGEFEEEEEDPAPFSAPSLPVLVQQDCIVGLGLHQSEHQPVEEWGSNCLPDSNHQQEKTVEADDTFQPAEADDTFQPAEADDTFQSTEADDTYQPAEADDFEETQEQKPVLKLENAPQLPLESDDAIGADFVPMDTDDIRSEQMISLTNLATLEKKHRFFLQNQRRKLWRQRRRQAFGGFKCSACSKVGVTNLQGCHVSNCLIMIFTTNICKIM